MNVNDFGAIYQNYSWETHDSVGSPCNGIFIQINSNVSPHQCFLQCVYNGSNEWVAFQPGWQVDQWCTLNFGRSGTTAYCRVTDRDTGQELASAEIPLASLEQYRFFHISSIQGISNNWWVDFEIDNLRLTAAPENTIGYVHRVDGGLLNGYAIDEEQHEISVAPGDAILGTIVVEIENLLSAGAVVPLGATVDWGDRTSQPWLVHPDIPPGQSTHTVTVNQTAPLVPGDYHLVVACEGELNLGQVMSGTNWTYGYLVWNDGNDIAFDWTDAQFDWALDVGAVPNTRLSATGPAPRWQPATAVIVHVVEDRATNEIGVLRRAAGGSLNGHRIDAESYRLTVLPGSAISGTVVLEAENRLVNPNAVVPLGGTLVWPDRTLHPWAEYADIPPGTGSYPVSVNATAPSDPGEYQLLFAFEGEYTIAQVTSATNWTYGADVWYDGNDLGFDWNRSERNGALWEGATLIAKLSSDGRHPRWQPATCVSIRVPYCPGDMDKDGQRDITDFTLFASSYGCQSCDPRFSPEADIDDDTFVDITDFTLFAASYGEPCP
jgi:hypothetical protein